MASKPMYKQSTSIEYISPFLKECIRSRCDRPLYTLANKYGTNFYFNSPKSWYFLQFWLPPLETALSYKKKSQCYLCNSANKYATSCYLPQIPGNFCSIKFKLVWLSELLVILDNKLSATKTKKPLIKYKITFPFMIAGVALHFAACFCRTNLWPCYEHCAH